MASRGIAFIIGSLLLLLATRVYQLAGETSRGGGDMFAFSVSYDAQRNAANVSDWLHRPAGKHGFVSSSDGHLATDAGPIRFWGTNLCYDACFPSRRHAQRMAARMARLGINCVRMHHMDAHSIWAGGNHLRIAPDRLDRLDYLIYQLKRHGIYTNLNLHVSRWFDRSDGFSDKRGRPQYDKGLDNFEPRMIELQKRYARDLLTHVNPYTKTAYTDEPAIAMVEINNENSLFDVWSRGQLDDLPQAYATTFRRLWNTWLRRKYGGTARLAAAWAEGQSGLGGELLRNGNFSDTSTRPWQLQRDEQSLVSWSIESCPYNRILGLLGEQGQKGQSHNCLRVVVTQAGAAAWIPQLINAGFSLKAEQTYQLSFRMRSDEPHRVQVGCMMAHPPWRSLGLSQSVAVSPQWKLYRLSFVACGDDERARINFSNLKPGSYELADVSLRPGGIVGLEPGQRLEDDSVAVLRRGRLNQTQAARRDFIDFLWQIDRDYWLEMYGFLKKDLRLRSAVAGTQRGYGPVFTQAQLDYIDAHAYWQHPEFPGGNWDMRNWSVRNTPMVNRPGGTLVELAAWRVWSMPYTVSEYNHPRPGVYADEGFPMIAAFGRFQDWDGVFSFAYAHEATVEPDHIEGFFDIRGDATKLVHMPACAAMLLRGDVQTARTTLLARLAPKTERELLYKNLSAWALAADALGIEPTAALVHGVAMELVSDSSTGGVVAVGENASDAKPQAVEKDNGVFISDTGELRWDVSRPGAGFFTVNSPRTKIFTGFGRGRSFKLGDVRLRLGETRRDWATISMVCLDAKAFSAAGRILIAATGMSHNRGAKSRATPQGGITLGDDWGRGPVTCEGVRAVITLPVAADRVRFYPLDEAGNRCGPLPVADADGHAELTLGPENKTLWYEAEIR